MMLLGLVARWLHILSAMAAVGGTIFARLALLPSLDVLGEADRKNLHDAVRRRWSKVVMAAIGFLLLSGFYNFIVIVKFDKIPEGYSKLYQPLFGVKFILALVIFFVASALVGRSEAFAGIRKQARFWLSLNLILAILLVCISGVMRLIRDQPAKSPPAVRAKLSVVTPKAFYIPAQGSRVRERTLGSRTPTPVVGP